MIASSRFMTDRMAQSQGSFKFPTAAVQFTVAPASRRLSRGHSGSPACADFAHDGVNVLPTLSVSRISKLYHDRVNSAMGEWYHFVASPEFCAIMEPGIRECPDSAATDL